MLCSRRPTSRFYRAFTLIELLTVIAIIGILAAIIIPTVGRVRQSARAAQCKSNLRQIGTALHLYAAENKDRMPFGLTAPKAPGTSNFVWHRALLPYLGVQNADRYDDKQAAALLCPGGVQPQLGAAAFSHYIANSKLMPQSWAGTVVRPFLSKITRPSAIVTVTDGFQRFDAAWADGQSDSLLDSSYFSGGAANGDNPVPVTNARFFIDYRHPGETANVVMVDASVKTVMRGDLLYRNFNHDY